MMHDSRWVGRQIRGRSPKPRRRRGRAFVWALVLLAVTTAWFGWRAWWQGLRGDLGEPSALLEDAWHNPPRVLDRHGRPLRELTDDFGRRGRPVTLDDVGTRLVQATLTSEDRAFFEHDGVSGAAMLRAAQQNIRHARLVSGASTITQQLVKMLRSRGVPEPRGVEVKLHEAALAQNLEGVLDKDVILVEYLNRLPYGHGLVGPEAAAMGYFGRHSRDLSWAQAALLAVLPRAPSALDPYAHRERAVLRQRALLQALHDEGWMTAADLARAQAEPIALRPIEHPFTASHFVDALMAEGRIEPHGDTPTTLDLRLQQDIEGLVRTHLVSVDQAGVSAASIVIDNHTGDVLAWVGSGDYDARQFPGQVDMVRARRQPGSTLKPFVVAAALAAGHLPTELVADVPTEFHEAGDQVYAPTNFYGDYAGPVALRDALAASLNVPMVRLAAELGPTAILDLLHRFGFASLDRAPEHYGISIALGTGEVELRELAGAYLSLARHGERIALRYTDADPKPAPERVLDAGIAAEITDALSDPLARARLVHGRSPFDIGFPLAIKTGTSSGYRDAWTVGFTAERTVAVWVGNPSGGGTETLTGAGAAGPLFADIMRRTMADVPRRAPLWSAGDLQLVEVCALSGLRPGADCPHRVQRRFARERLPTQGCGLHVRARRSGSEVPGWRCDRHGRDVLVRLPPVYSPWLARMPSGAPGRDVAGLQWLAAEAVGGCDGGAGNGEVRPHGMMGAAVGR